MPKISIPIKPIDRYKLVNEMPIWVYHNMAPAVCFDAQPAESATQGPDEIEPTVSAGAVIFSDLTHGGLFDFIAREKKPIIVEDLVNPGGGTVSLVDPVANTTRVAPATTPFVVAPGEIISVTSGTPGSCSIGFLIREDIPAR